MPLCHFHFFSETLRLGVGLNVLLPPKRTDPLAPLPVLYLLHGLSDDHSTWLRRTSIERYAEAYDLAVVMPEVARSFYTNMVHGLNYWTFLSEELPAILKSWFPQIAGRDQTFAAGLSMGGYGALKLALRRPDLVCAAASLSGTLDLAWGLMGAEIGGILPEAEGIFGDLTTVAGGPEDLLALATTLAQSKPREQLPKLYQCCGTEDFLYAQNQSFRRHVEALPFDLTYEEEPGTHEWGYWDKKIQRVLEWLPLGGAEPGGRLI